MLLIVLVLSATQGIAQNTILPDMSFSLSLRSLPDLAANTNLVTEATYYRKFLYYTGQYYVPSLTRTNSLEVIVEGLDTIPTTAWIMEQDNGGHFSPVLAITNFFGDNVSGAYIDQIYTLTPDQIRSLIQGTWYVAFTMDGTNYLGNLTPQYATANGPTVRPVAGPPLIATNYYGNEYYVLSKDNRAARVVLDGSASTDPFYLPMGYSWQVSTWDAANRLVFAGKGMLLKRDFLVGTYAALLQADDGIATGPTSGFYLHVITASQAVAFAGITVSNSNMSAPQAQSLNSLLKTATTEFDHGRMSQGCFVLQEYLSLVKKFHSDPETTAYLSQYAQRIIDTLNSAN